MINRKSINIEVLFAWILFFVLFVYLILRVVSLPFLEDEIATWFIYILHKQLTPINEYVDANNHILNTILSWISGQLFNTSPEVLRLPNLLFFPVYFIYTFRITRYIQDRFVRIVIFLGLILAHHFFDFFGLCRGYGIAMGLLMAAIYNLIQYLSDHKFRHLAATLILSFFMVWAHLSLLGTAYIFFPILLFSVLTNNQKIVHKVWMILFLVVSFVLMLGYSTWYAIYLQSIGKIYLGIQEGGFIKTTILTLLDVLFRWRSIYMFLLPAIYFMLIIFGAFVSLYKNGIRVYLNNPLNLFTILLVGNILLIYIEHWLLGVVYPKERATLYFYPLLLIALGFTIDYLKQVFKKKNIVYIVTPILLVPLHFLLSVNLDYASAYRWESFPERYIRYIQNNASQCDIYPIVSMYDYDRWVYDNYRYDGNIPYIDEYNYADTVADFQIGKFKDNPHLRLLYDSLDYDSRNDFLLLKRKVFLNRIPVLHYDNITTNGKTDTEYFGFTPEGNNDTLFGTHFLFYFDLVISSPQEAFEGFIIPTLKNSQIYDPLFLDRISYQWNKKSLKVGVVITEKENLDNIPLVYFWNKKKVPFSIENGSLTIYRLE